MWVKDVNDFYDFWERTLAKYRDYIESEFFSLYVQCLFYRYSYLVGDMLDRTKYEMTGGGRKVQTDGLDIKILRLLGPNARIPNLDISNLLGISINTVSSRIKKMLEKGIIQGFRLTLIFQK